MTGSCPLERDGRKKKKKNETPSGSISPANTFGDMKACVDKKNRLQDSHVCCLTHVTL